MQSCDVSTDGDDADMCTTMYYVQNPRKKEGESILLESNKARGHRHRCREGNRSVGVVIVSWLRSCSRERGARRGEWHIVTMRCINPSGTGRYPPKLQHQVITTDLAQPDSCTELLSRYI